MSCMRVVIVGERLRSVSTDDATVFQLIDGLKGIYSDLCIVSTGCDRGIGKTIKNRMMPKEENIRTTEVDFIEVAFRIYASDRPKAWYAKQYQARNQALLALGDEFHIFLDKSTHGAMYDLWQLVVDAGLPCSVYLPNEVTGPKLLR